MCVPCYIAVLSVHDKIPLLPRHCISLVLLCYNALRRGTCEILVAFKHSKVKNVDCFHFSASKDVERDFLIRIHKGTETCVNTTISRRLGPEHKSMMVI